MKQWTVRVIPALALAAALGACSDSALAPEPRDAAAGVDANGAGSGLARAFLSVSAGLGFTCGTTLDGAAYCWGENGSGQLGTGDFDARAVPARVAGVPAALAASTGAAHACALTAAGEVYCWGDNSAGQLGDGTTSGSASPVRVRRPAGVRFVSVTTGAVHGCGLATDRATYCWGDNSAGQLGDGTLNGSSVPVRVQAPAGAVFRSVRSGDGAAHTCAVGAAGAAWCWGDNSYGQLGTGAAGAPSTVPVRVAGGVRFTAVAGSGLGHTCAVSTAAQAYCWGDNSNGQLGDGTTVPRPLPTAVLSTRRYASVETGWFHSCGSTFLSGAYCWGDANGGKLGNGTASGFTAAPVAVTASQGFGQMDPGADHSCARRVDGAAYCWGQGFSGQLGDGQSTNSAVPVRVANPGSTPAASRAAGAGRAQARDGVAEWCRARAARGAAVICA
ncbi:hypothetical protein HKM21_23000 [Longimicrobium terrae]|uniref:Chromosome condensation regulator RCC1 n=2 Tax=Longimicrobium terrae TaxID=1639882 RepID=A0A841H3A1_9BACT|nr:RCC1 domain-containing protein [Longimicrobium terrae]MBB6072448.1 hypothetical protein [Longimicrobium terrae]NNC32138.1 hypothetical protein [Longimicrobium terrae]